MCFVLFLLLFIAQLFPQGTTALSFATIDQGAVTSSLGKANAADLNTIEGIYANPASLASLKTDIEVVASYSPLMVNVDGMALFASAVSFRLPGIGALALGVTGLTYGAMTGYADDSLSEVKIDAFDIGVKAAGGFSLPFGLDLGICANYIRETLYDTTLQALLFNGGAIYTIRKVIPNSTLAFGLLAKNAGIGLSASADTLPMSFSGGVAFRTAFSKEFHIKVLADYEYFLDAPWKIKGGIEAKVFGFCFIRGGYVYGDQNAEGLTAGLGFDIPIVEGMKTKIDYSFAMLGPVGVRQTMQLNVAYNFSKTE